MIRCTVFRTCALTCGMVNSVAIRPTDATTPLDEAFIGHGYVSEDGVTENNDDSVDNIVAWQNAVTVRAARTESTLTLNATLIQTRGSNLELFYPGSFVEANGDEFKIEVKPAVSDPRAFVLNRRGISQEFA
jgi:hypothetical protein